MNNSTFEELLNLYVDREISEDQRALLKQELAVSSDRLRKFKIHCRLHKATCTVLSFDSSRLTSDQDAVQHDQGMRWIPVLQASLGVAACVGFIFTISIAVLQKPANLQSAAVDEPREDVSEPVNYTEVKFMEPANDRLAASQSYLASWAPDTLPSDQPFETVNLEHLNPKDHYLQPRAWELDRASSLRPVQWTKSIEPRYRVFQESPWPAGFQSSLAGY